MLRIPYHTGSANSLSFYKPGASVCVNVCLFITNGFSSDNFNWEKKPTDELQSSRRKEKEEGKTINNVYSLLKRSDAYAYVHAMIVTVFVDIIYAYSLSSLCVHASLSRRESAFSWENFNPSSFFCVCENIYIIKMWARSRSRSLRVCDNTEVHFTIIDRETATVLLPLPLLFKRTELNMQKMTQNGKK